MPVAAKPLLATLALGLVLIAAAPAAGQQAPTLGAPPSQTTTAAPPPTTTSTGNGGLETWQELLIFGAGLALILGIAFAILGDARERAAKLHHGRPEAATAGPTTHKHRQQSKERARAKGRAARRSRRRNR